MVAISRGEIWWADLAEPTGSEPIFRRPVLVVQSEAFNRSKLQTVVCVALTSNLAWADAPGNVLLPSSSSGLSKDSVANVSQIITIDRKCLTELVGKVAAGKLQAVLDGIGILLGR
jgi:mRNA interferase MazF